MWRFIPVYGLRIWMKFTYISPQRFLALFLALKIKKNPHMLRHLAEKCFALKYKPKNISKRTKVRSDHYWISMSVLAFLLEIEINFFERFQD